MKVHVGALPDLSIALPRNDWEFYVLWISRHRTLNELHVAAIVKSLVYLGQEQNQLKHYSICEYSLASKPSIAEVCECAESAAETVISKLVETEDREPAVWRYSHDLVSATHSLAYYILKGDSKTVEDCMEPIRDITAQHPFFPLSADAQSPERILAESMHALYLVDPGRCRSVILETLDRNRRAIFTGQLA